MQQLSGLDASFLALETANTTGHVGGLSILDPSDVRVRSRCRPSVTSSATAPASRREASMRRPNIAKVPPTMFCGSDRKFAPNHQNTE